MAKAVVLRVGGIQSGVLQVLELQLEPAQVDPSPICVLSMVEVAGAVDVVHEYLHLLCRHWAAEHIPVRTRNSIGIIGIEWEYITVCTGLLRGPIGLKERASWKLRAFVVRGEVLHRRGVRASPEYILHVVILDILPNLLRILLPGFQSVRPSANKPHVKIEI